MPDIDLIPSDYRQRLVRLRQLKLHAAAAILLAAGCASAYAGLNYARRQLQVEVDQLQQAKAVTEVQRNELARLQAEHTQLSERARLQAGLSGGLTAQHMFLLVDRALRGDEVWFTRWNFQRSGKHHDQPAEAAASGYILSMPKAAGQADAKTWRIDTQMTIQGQARDHAALSAFVGRLIAQPEVDTAQLLKASLQGHQEQGVIEFELMVRIDMANKS